MKDGDFFRWSYTDNFIKSSGMVSDIYWCCSRIAIIKDGFLVDTFWHGGDSRRFHKSDVGEKIDVEFISNIDDLVNASPEDRAYYLDSDCVDLNHANSTRGNFYIRRGATKNLDKIKRVIAREKNHLERSIELELRSIAMLEKDLEAATLETRVYTSKGVSLNDESWYDK